MLTPEDNLRLNVLLATHPHAIRIDESSLQVYGLSAQGEAKINLHPNCRPEHYLRQVREMLSGHVLNSPGGYPVYLKRWTRMGQARGEANLRQLLLLGEPEAVVAVVHSPDLTPELAGYAWWAMPVAENARQMLHCPAVVQSERGVEFARYLFDHLAFETEASVIIETVRLILQTGLLTPEQVQQLWDKGRKLVYRVGFLLTRPHQLPNPLPDHPDYEILHATLAPLCAAQNEYALCYCQLLSAAGQTFLHTSYQLLEKATHQEMIVTTLQALEAYFSRLPLPPTTAHRQIEPLLTEVSQLYAATSSELADLQILLANLTHLPTHQTAIRALLFLALLREAIILPIFSTTTATGSLMRTKLLPVSQPILTQMRLLLAS